MRIILSVLMFVVLVLWIGTLYFSNKKKFRMVEYNRKQYYLLSQNMYFVILTVCTAPIFLSSLSLLKYGLWLVVILWLLFSNKVRMVMEPTMVMYLIFFLWLVFATTYSSVPRDAFMMLVKYALPLCFLWLGYSAINNDKDLIVFLKVINAAACIYCIFIGGQGFKLMPWLYFSALGAQFATYAPFANYLTALFIAPIILYWLTQDKKYIFCALWMILSTVLESVRTGMGGMVLVFTFAMFLRYKSRSIPGILFAGAVFIGTILFVPSVNKKFYGDRGDEVTATDIVRGNALSLDNIDTNGRDALWEFVLDRFYDGHELCGSGLGVAGRYIKDLWIKKESGVAVMHNDYVQLLAETGLVGVSLLVLFYIFVIVKVMQYVVLQRSGYLVRLTGIMALSSMAGIAFSMYFDNVVSNSMQAMIIPYIYLGFFLKMVDKEKQEKVALELARFRKEEEIGSEDAVSVERITDNV